MSSRHLSHPTFVAAFFRAKNDNVISGLLSKPVCVKRILDYDGSPCLRLFRTFNRRLRTRGVFVLNGYLDVGAEPQIKRSGHPTFGCAFAADLDVNKMQTINRQHQWACPKLERQVGRLSVPVPEGGFCISVLGL